METAPPSSTPPPILPAGSKMSPKMAAGLCAIFAPLASIFFFNDDDPFVQFWARQTAYFGVVGFIISIVLSFLVLPPLIVLVFWVIGIIQAFQGSMWEYPGYTQMMTQFKKKS